jgi:hypothetical protein
MTAEPYDPLNIAAELDALELEARTNFAAPSVLDKPELRILSNYKRWAPEITPQPEFGADLQKWIDEHFAGDVRALAAEIETSVDTVRKWIAGQVPNRPKQEALRRAGYRGDFWPRKWSQSQFVRSELVKVRNKNWKPGDWEGREYKEKYCVVARIERNEFTGRGKSRVSRRVVEEVELLFPTRVSDVAKVISNDEALCDWTGGQTLTHALGEPVLRGKAYSKEGVLEPVEIRGTWRKIEAWTRKCLTHEITIDHEKSILKPMEPYSSRELLDAHKQAYLDRYKTRDRAGELGTRAHKLGHAWLKFHEYQHRDESGRVLVERILAPHWFWYPESDSSELYEWELEWEPPEVIQALLNLEEFIAQNELEIVATELLLADMVHGVAGACDCIARDKFGNLVFLDWKTSGGVYPTMFLQITWYARLYWLCYRVMPARAYIIRLDKLTARVDRIPVFEDGLERQEHLEAAIHAVHLYRWNKGVEAKLDAIRLEVENG